MKRFEFQLDISADRYLSYYRGTVSQVIVQCFNGMSVQFPALMLTPFVSTRGIQGNFVLTCDDDFKGSRLKRLPSRT